MMNTKEENFVNEFLTTRGRPDFERSVVICLKNIGEELELLRKELKTSRESADIPPFVKMSKISKDSVDELSELFK